MKTGKADLAEEWRYNKVLPQENKNFFCTRVLEQRYRVITNGLDILSFQYPYKQTAPNLIFDPSFVRRIDQSGFIGGLYKN